MWRETRYTGGQRREFGEFHCKLGDAVQIEPGLRTQSPRFVCDELKAHCDKAGIPNIFRELSTDGGYYAWHFYVQVPVELMLEDLVVERNLWVEIQITTQLAEVITALTHELYEVRRSGSRASNSQPWKWDAGSHEFRSAYLGHGLHLLEGIIQNLKDDLLSQSSPSVPPSEALESDASNKLPSGPGVEQ